MVNYYLIINNIALITIIEIHIRKGFDKSTNQKTQLVFYFLSMQFPGLQNTRGLPSKSTHCTTSITKSRLVVSIVIVS